MLQGSPANDGAGTLVKFVQAIDNKQIEALTKLLNSNVAIRDLILKLAFGYALGSGAYDVVRVFLNAKIFFENTEVLRHASQAVTNGKILKLGLERLHAQCRIKGLEAQLAKMKITGNATKSITLADFIRAVDNKQIDLLTTLLSDISAVKDFVLKMAFGYALGSESQDVINVFMNSVALRENAEVLKHTVQAATLGIKVKDNLESQYEYCKQDDAKLKSEELLIGMLKAALSMARNDVPPTRLGLLKGLKIALVLDTTFELVKLLVVALSKLPFVPVNQEGLVETLSSQEIECILKVTLDKDLNSKRAVGIIKTIASMSLEKVRANPLILYQILMALIKDKNNYVLIAKILRIKNTSLSMENVVKIFHWAVRMGELEILKSVLEKVVFNDEAVSSAIVIAIRQGQDKIFSYLVDPENVTLQSIEKAFIDAAGKDEIDIISGLYSKSEWCQNSLIVYKALKNAQKNSCENVATYLRSLLSLEEMHALAEADSSIAEQEAQAVKDAQQQGSPITPSYKLSHQPKVPNFRQISTNETMSVKPFEKLK